MAEEATAPTEENATTTPVAVEPSTTPPGALTDVEPVDEPAQEPEAKPEKPAVPEEYEFQPPEFDGKPVEVDPVAFEAIKGRAKELGLTQEQFQGMTEFGMRRVAELTAGPYQQWHQTQRDWQNQIKADPDIGGDKLSASLADASKAIDFVGTKLPAQTVGDQQISGADQIRQALNITGGGNNPTIVRMMVELGRALGDAKGLSLGQPAAKQANSAEDRARRIYNNPDLYPTNG